MTDKEPREFLLLKLHDCYNGKCFQKPYTLRDRDWNTAYKRKDYEQINVIEKSAYDKLKAENTDLKAHIKELVEALEFYGNIACPLPSQINDNEIVKYREQMDRQYERGGRRARQALTKHRENNETSGGE